MKKLLLLTLIPMFALTGCVGADEGDDSPGENLPYNAEQSKEKMAELATSEGYEVSFKTKDDDDESEVATLGVKNHYVWYSTESDHSLFKYESGVLTSYEYNEETGKFVKDAEVEYDASYVDTMIAGYSSWLYYANSFDGGNLYHKVGDVTFAGRSATQYYYSVNALVVKVKTTVVIDKATGVTLFWDVTGSAIDGEHGSAAYEVTSFKTGSQVVIPSIQEE